VSILPLPLLGWIYIWGNSGGIGSGLAFCCFPFPLHYPAHCRVMKSDMRRYLLLGITMVKMSPGNCPVSFRSGPDSRQETVQRGTVGKSLHARDLAIGGFLLQIR
jgi:hypothetical protein